MRAHPSAMVSASFPYDAFRSDRGQSRIFLVFFYSFDGPHRSAAYTSTAIPMHAASVQVKKSSLLV